MQENVRYEERVRAGGRDYARSDDGDQRWQLPDRERYALKTGTVKFFVWGIKKIFRKEGVQVFIKCMDATKRPAAKLRASLSTPLAFRYYCSITTFLKYVPLFVLTITM